MLESDRFYLRRFVASDLPLLVELESDPEILKYITNGVARTNAEIKQRLEKVIAQTAAQEPLGVWGAWQKSNDEFIGWFMLRYYERFPEPELGFMIVKRHWGKGYTYEISKRLVDLGRELKLASIVAITDAKNTASIRVLEKCNFKFEKIVEVPSGPANLYRLNFS